MVSFGVGVNRFQLDVEAGDENPSGKIDVTSDSAPVYVKGSFGSIADPGNRARAPLSIHSVLPELTGIE